MIQSDNVSRRKFIHNAAVLTAGAAAAPYLIPSGALAAPGREGANERVVVGGIGVGRQGTSDLKIANAANLVRIAAIADLNIKRAKALAANYEAEAYQDYRKLLDRKDIDAVITATPDHWRSLICVHACQAGKDVYAEKPMTLTIAEGRLMVEAARKYGRVFQVGSQQRSTAANRAGCRMVREGRIGKIKKVLAGNLPSPWECGLPAQPVPEELDWDAWCGPVEPLPYHINLYLARTNPGWMSFRPFSGGEMTAWGSHGLDQVQWALGMDDAGPVEVWTEGDKLPTLTYAEPEPNNRGNGICNRPKVFFRYPNGVVVEGGGGSWSGGIFVGEKGTITIERNLCKSDPPEIVGKPLRDKENHVELHLRNWIDCIKSRERPAADVEIGHRSATVCHLGNIARWTGRRLRWDPAREVFPDDAEANAYLDRPRRKHYELPNTI
ncbi:MAG: Gfo/Idh/MocA family oxidoreductase [Pirellulales bacterium]|nr:Gfo/Idh/MocA family oxidoreductase [Pirellulales bacterium]